MLTSNDVYDADFARQVSDPIIGGDVWEASLQVCEEHILQQNFARGQELLQAYDVVMTEASSNALWLDAALPDLGDLDSPAVLVESGHIAYHVAHRYIALKRR